MNEDEFLASLAIPKDWQRRTDDAFLRTQAGKGGLSYRPGSGPRPATNIPSATLRALYRRAAGKCEQCRAVMWSVVHHLSYDHMGREHPDELQLLCRPCHKAVHFPDGSARWVSDTAIRTVSDS